jgi:hypothetical protein
MLLLALLLASPPGCDTSSATRTSVLAIRADPERFVGRRVTVTGFSNGISLFAHPRPLKQLLKAKRWGSADKSQMIGVYALPRLDEAMQAEERRRGLEWTVTGIVDTCERMIARSEAEAGDIVYVSGYCHYWDGPVLLAEHAEFARIERRR